MSALGLSCNVKRGRIVVRGVLLQGGSADLVFDHAVAGEEDLALQLRSLGNALTTLFKDLDVTSVVIRSADYHRSTGLKDYVVLRLRGEGVLLATARAHAGLVACLTGHAIGEKCGMKKDEVDERAAVLLSEDLVEATAAALAAEQLRTNSSHS
ncbi:MAG: hypothetical protein F4Z00_02450 [Acidimicrobiaceae bacterium]|nr:hypothetical protein [Acidimicrobiaceae bacterium]MXZ64392.1 hypothetical protein [Acidimicrobiaceae bacterium]MYF33851.1 hypothetical protein [Acidimicrobiaceae bacterium]MYG76804.1 hypothetical protein [Acidimicrobiaceae bacterium]MYJ84152.1 hypothetical protein [Acidimicrobiaceae bacterium]